MVMVVELSGEPGKWAEIGRLRAGEIGSLSDNSGEGREILRFYVEDGVGFVERSRGGVDSEFGGGRVVASLGFETLARLQSGEKYEQKVQTDLMAEAVDARWRME